MIMFWKILIIVAFIGMLKPLAERIWDSIKPFVSRIVSLFLLGLILGIGLATVMIIGEFLCICESMYIFGYHPFWVGFVLGSGWTILTSLIHWLKS